MNGFACKYLVRHLGLSQFLAPIPFPLQTPSQHLLLIVSFLITPEFLIKKFEYAEHMLRFVAKIFCFFCSCFFYPFHIKVEKKDKELKTFTFFPTAFFEQFREKFIAWFFKSSGNGYFGKSKDEEEIKYLLRNRDQKCHNIIYEFLQPSLPSGF